MQSYNGVILDEASFNRDDLDLRGLLCRLEHWQRYPDTEHSQREQRLQGAAVAVANRVVFDRGLLQQLDALELILLTATGTDKVDMDYCRERDITVMPVSDYCTASVAQHVFSLLLALTTRLIPYQQATRAKRWLAGSAFSSLEYPIHELQGQTLGLVGYGALARGVEQIARAFGMRILIAERAGASQVRPGRMDLYELLPEVDVLSLHCPLTDETRHLIGNREFDLMKPSAMIINTARGAVINNAELANALRQGKIAAAGLDVLDNEPPPAEHPLLAPDVPNLIVTPHIAWASVEARQRVIDQVADNLRQWLDRQA
ncbi:MAG: D-2-hydroxyacid dehydrogenase [Gammaproteobacteria bacterium]|nr:D-2-hydroxyacid dehydrogenase [Gammaproteobacteria bacterium]